MPDLEEDSPASHEPPRPSAGDETIEYSLDQDELEHEHAAPAHDPAGPPHENEDVLEETPEFLQDTPDHDRLWFEQRPPKDFDFDE